MTQCQQCTGIIFTFFIRKYQKLYTENFLPVKAWMLRVAAFKFWENFLKEVFNSKLFKFCGVWVLRFDCIVSLSYRSKTVYIKWHTYLNNSLVINILFLITGLYKYIQQFSWTLGFTTWSLSPVNRHCIECWVVLF